LKLKIVLIEWYDAASMNEWKMPNEPYVEREPVLTAGILKAKSKNEVVVCTAATQDGAFASDLAIPLGCIKSMKTIHTHNWRSHEAKPRVSKS